MAVTSRACVVLCMLVLVHADFVPLTDKQLKDVEHAVHKLVKISPFNEDTRSNVFDYIVVGAGAAGFAVAARLKLAGFSVLLLEAGRKPSNITWVPELFQQLRGSEMDWQYQTLPNNKSCLSLEGQQCRISAGKTLGGSTAINYMMYVRGNPIDYEMNIPGWTYLEMLPYFKRYQGLRDIYKYPNTSWPYHNTTGNMDIGYCADPEYCVQYDFVVGLASLGFPINQDCNGESQIGVTRVATFTTANGTRETSASGYLYLDNLEENLPVSIETQVTRILFDKNNRANGVTAFHNTTGNNITVQATHGVIISAGTMGTPHLLMLSGIGPATILNKYNIDVRSDLPVGSNLTDHVEPLIYIRVKNLPLSGFYADRKSVMQSAVSRYIATQSGPLASIGFTDISGFANTLCYNETERYLNNSQLQCKVPTLQFINAYLLKGAISDDIPLFKQTTQLSDDVISQLKEVNKDCDIIAVSPVVLHPMSRGWVRLASANPFDPPEIFLNFLDDMRDVEEMLRSITIVEHLVNTPHFHYADILHLRLPGCPDYEDDRTAYWTCYVRHMTCSGYHATGTCALGSVLDNKMGVRGVSGLYVADLSVLPQIPHGNTAAPAIALGERLADFLINDHNKSSK